MLYHWALQFATYLQFICFNVATAICIISPPCLKESDKTKKCRINGASSALMHKASAFCGVIYISHPPPPNINSLWSNPSFLFNCTKSLIFPCCREEIIPGRKTTKAWTVAVITRFAIRYHSPAHWAEGNERQREKWWGGGEKVILMNVLI